VLCCPAISWRVPVMLVLVGAENTLPKPAQLLNCRHGDGDWPLSLRFVSCAPWVLSPSHRSMRRRSSARRAASRTYVRIFLRCVLLSALSAQIRCMQEQIAYCNPLTRCYGLDAFQVVIALGTFCCNTVHGRAVIFVYVSSFRFFTCLFPPWSGGSRRGRHAVGSTGTTHESSSGVLLQRVS